MAKFVIKNDDHVRKVINALYESDSIRKFNGQLYFYSSAGWTVIEDDGKDSLFNMVLKHLAPEGWDSRRISNVYDSLMKMVKIVELEDEYKIYTPHHVMNLETGSFNPYTHSKSTIMNSSINVEPNHSKTSLDWWDKMLSNAFNGDKEMITAYYEMIGLSMMTKKEKFEKSYWIVGRAGSGKSTIVYNVIQGLHNKQNLEYIDPSEWNSTSDSFHLMANKMVNISSDDDGKSFLDTKMFKRMVSQEIVTAKVKYKAPIRFKNTALLINIGNDLPNIGERTNGPYRRMIILEMNNVIKDEDKRPEVKDWIRKNKDGVLNYIASQAIQAIQKAFDANRLTEPEVAKESLRNKKTEDNKVFEWVLDKREHLINLANGFEDGVQGITVTKLGEEFGDWAKTAGYGRLGRNKVLKMFELYINDMQENDEDKFYLANYCNKKYIRFNGKDKRQKEIEDKKREDDALERDAQYAAIVEKNQKEASW